MLTLIKLQNAAKTANIKGNWKMKKVELIAALLKHHTVATEAELEFIINGGEIKKLPDAPDQIESNTDEKCAGYKAEPKAPRKPRKAKKADKPAAKPKAKKDGSISLKDICEELNVEPRIARRKLRNSDITKPAEGWNWSDAKEIEKVKGIIK